MASTNEADADAEEEANTIRRCQAGEIDAFQPIVERYGDLLYGTAYLMLRDRGQAEDAVQEAFISGWKGIGSFDGSRSLRPWLMRILINHVLQRRRRKLLPSQPLSDSANELPSGAVGPEQAVERAWERAEVRKALATLPDDAARVVVLRYSADLSLQEISETLSLPLGTVKSRLNRALKRLQKELTRQGMTGANAPKRDVEEEAGE